MGERGRASLKLRRLGGIVNRIPSRQGNGERLVPEGAGVESWKIRCHPERSEGSVVSTDRSNTHSAHPTKVPQALRRAPTLRATRHYCLKLPGNSASARAPGRCPPQRSRPVRASRPTPAGPSGCRFVRPASTSTPPGSCPPHRASLRVGRRCGRKVGRAAGARAEAMLPGSFRQHCLVARRQYAPLSLSPAQLFDALARCCTDRLKAPSATPWFTCRSAAQRIRRPFTTSMIFASSTPLEVHFEYSCE